MYIISCIIVMQRTPRCQLRSALHYLRKYPNMTCGFMFSRDENEMQRIAVLKVARTSWCVRDYWYQLKSLHETMLIHVICKYQQVFFYRAQVEQRQDKDCEASCRDISYIISSFMQIYIRDMINLFFSHKTIYNYNSNCLMVNSHFAMN